MPQLFCSGCGEEITPGQAVARVETGLVFEEDRLMEMPDFEAEHYHLHCLRPAQPPQGEEFWDICRLCGNLTWKGRGIKAVGCCRLGLKGSSCGSFKILEYSRG